MMIAPDMLRIIDGEIHIKTGGGDKYKSEDVNLQEYLSQWQMGRGIKNNTPVCIICTERLQELYDQIDTLNNLMLAS